MRSEYKTLVKTIINTGKRRNLKIAIKRRDNNPKDDFIELQRRKGKQFYQVLQIPKQAWQEVPEKMNELIKIYIKKNL